MGKDIFIKMNILQEKFKALKKQMQDKWQLLDSDIEDEKRYEIVAGIQQDLIDYATFLEEEMKLYDTDVIQMLNTTCELCYRYVVTHELYLKSFLYIMKMQLDIIGQLTFTCVKKGAYNLSIVAIIKNEMYMREWIEYHRMIGVSHFYIYDNESTNHLKEELKDYIDMGIVTYHYFPGSLVQHKAYNHAVENYQFETKYMAIIDADEYIVPMQDALVPDIVEQIFKDYESVVFKESEFAGGVGINWREYGTSHHKEKQDGLCVENYMYRAADDYFQNVHIKTIFIPRVIMNIANPHFPYMEEGWRNISENGSMIPHSYFYDSMCKKLRINHYFCKSEEEFMQKLKRGWPDRVHEELAKTRIDKEMNLAINTCNEMYDPIMEKYIPELKKRLKRS